MPFLECPSLLGFLGVAIGEKTDPSGLGVNPKISIGDVEDMLGDTDS